MQNFPPLFSSPGRCFVIAEIGTSHEGDRSKVRDLVRAAAEAGADCAKFQLVIAREILHPLTGDVDLPGGRISLFERFRALESPLDFYQFCKDEVERQGMVFLASPFGIESARMLKTLGSLWYKVASPELNHFQLLEELASYASPLILSTGVSRLSDIEAAWETVGDVPKALLHCITAYPAPPEEYNLSILRPLSVLFGCPVGVSDHSMDPQFVPLVALVAGARLIEKHLCLDRSEAGLDDPIALDPRMFSQMVGVMRQLEAIPENRWRTEVEASVGPGRVKAILGDGKKSLAESEKANYERTNRSLHLRDTCQAGHTLTELDVLVLRTEKFLRPGLGPQFLKLVLGKKLQRTVEAGQGLVWDDLVQGP